MDWVLVKLEKPCEEMVTLKLTQALCIADVSKVAEDRRTLI